MADGEIISCITRKGTSPKGEGKRPKKKFPASHLGVEAIWKLPPHPAIAKKINILGQLHRSESQSHGSTPQRPMCVARNLRNSSAAGCRFRCRR